MNTQERIRTGRRLLALAVVGVVALTACGTSNGENDRAASDLNTSASTEIEVTDEASEAIDFPNEPIRVVIGFGEGGAFDTVNRRLAPVLSDILGVPVQIENIPGAGGMVGMTEAYNATPDGYTLSGISPAPLRLNELLGFIDFPSTGFELLGLAVQEPGLISVRPDSPYETLQDLHEASRSETHTLSLAGLTGGTGVGVLYYQSFFEDLMWERVPYDSGAEQEAALLGGHVDLSMRLGSWYEYHPDELRILAVTSEERVEELPDVPTVQEATGEEFVFFDSHGLAVHSDTDPEIIAILKDAYEQAVNHPDFKDGFYEDTGIRWGAVTGNAANELRGELEETAEIVAPLIEEIEGEG